MRKPMLPPETHYAKSGGVHIAYQQFGTGQQRLVLVPGWASHVEYAWEEPMCARFLEGLGSFATVVWFDKRGTGLSDRVSDLPILEVRMDDLHAVMDAVGWHSAAVFGVSEGGSMSALFAATYPERVSALVLCGAFAKRLKSPDYPWAPTLEERQSWIAQLEAGWGGDLELGTLAPSMVNDAGFKRWFSAYGRMSVSPSAAVALATMNTYIDIRDVLPTIHVPTLVLHRSRDRDVEVGNGRYLAEHIPGAKWVELNGDDHLWWVGNTEEILGEVEEFLTGVRSPGPSGRVLATILFTDIVGSTRLASQLGDEKWTAVLLRHNQTIRRLIDRFGGREVKTTGDGFLATFDGPARGLKCALAAQEAARKLGISVRAGLHVGECERLDHDIGGLSVHVAARVAELGDGERTLVTSTVKDLVSGSGLGFVDIGEHDLHGLPGTWRLFAVSSPRP